MRVIDLLNKIANGEEVPKKFMVDGDTLYIGEDKFIEYANGERIEWFIYPSWLNEEVEILEEEKKLPMKIYRKVDDDTYMTTIGHKDYKGNKNNFEELSDMYRQKINEIIDYLDYLKSKGE